MYIKSFGINVTYSLITCAWLAQYAVKFNNESQDTVKSQNL